MKYCLDCNKPKSRKGSYCKTCGYKHRVRPVGLKYVLVKENPTAFKKGHTPWTKGTRGIVIAWNKGIKGKQEWMNIDGLQLGHGWNKGLPHLKDEKHPNWKGDSVGYGALHSWIKRKLGEPSECMKCKTRVAKRFEWANISGKYKRDFSDWIRLCSKCHANEHKNWRYRWHVT